MCRVEQCSNKLPQNRLTAIGMWTQKPLSIVINWFICYAANACLLNCIHISLYLFNESVNEKFQSLVVLPEN